MFYPKGLPHAKELAYASERLTSIEVNGTFYRSQTPATFRKWASEVPDGFVFSLKGSRFATNRRVLAEAGDSIKRFLNSGVTELGDQLGPLLWQFAPFKKFDAADFGKFLEAAAGHVRRPYACATSSRCGTTASRRRSSSRCCGSSRSPSVYTDHDTYPNIADVTGDFVYARLQQGEDTIPTAYPPKEIDEWAERLADLGGGQGAEGPRRVDGKHKPKAAPRDVFAYVIHEGKVRAPAAAMALIERLKG